MAEWDLPAFLQRRGNDPESWILPALQAGANQALQRQKLKQDQIQFEENFRLTQQSVASDLLTEQMNRDLKTAELNDTHKLASFWRENAGKPLDDILTATIPDYSTPKAFGLHHSMLNTVTMQKAQTTANLLKSKTLNHFIDRAGQVEVENYGDLMSSVNPDGTIPKESWDFLKAAEDETLKNAQEKLTFKNNLAIEKEIARQKAIGGRQLENTIQRGLNYLAGIDEKAMYGAYERVHGVRPPNRDTFVRWAATEMRKNDDKLDFEASVSAANSLFDKQIKETGPTGSGGKVLHWNPTKQDFE